MNIIEMNRISIHITFAHKEGASYINGDSNLTTYIVILKINLVNKKIHVKASLFQINKHKILCGCNIKHSLSQYNFICVSKVILCFKS